MLNRVSKGSLATFFVDEVRDDRCIEIFSIDGFVHFRPICSWANSDR
jgi:hypothetical protein